VDKIYLDNCLRTGRLLKKRLHSCAGLCKLCILLVLVVQDLSGRADLQGSYKVRSPADHSQRQNASSKRNRTWLEVRLAANGMRFKTGAAALGIC
jgi:hypothetical protein